MSEAPGLATLVAITAGCAIGAVLRFEISRRLIKRFGDAFPWGTLLVNLTGCFLAGGLLASIDGAASPVWVAFLSAGVLGGYTTVSSFSLEAALMFQRGHTAGALGYVAASMFGCVAAAASGFGLVILAGSG